VSLYELDTCTFKKNYKNYKMTCGSYCSHPLAKMTKLNKIYQYYNQIEKKTKVEPHLKKPTKTITKLLFKPII